jgi:hypothetical protein
MMVVNHHMSQDAIMVVTTQHDTKCPPNDSSSWCAGYKAGYEINWALLNTENNIFGGNDIANGRNENPIEYSSKHVKRTAHSPPNMVLFVFSPSFNLGW